MSDSNDDNELSKAIDLRMLAGFSVDTIPEPIHFVPRHMGVSGITGESGKSTLVAGIISRWATPGNKIIVFITKRDEEIFNEDEIMGPNGKKIKLRRMQPYLMQKVDHQSLKILLESFERKRNLGLNIEEKLIRACEGARTFEDVYQNTIEKFIQWSGEKGQKENANAGLWLILKTRLEELIAQLSAIKFAPKFDPIEGINIVDIHLFSDVVKQLIIDSAATLIRDKMHDTVMYIPEAATILPKGYNSPAKLSVQRLVEAGRSSGNFVILDAQAFTQVHTPILKQLNIVFVGKQQEPNEVIKSLNNIPAAQANKPRPDQIMQLTLGQFYAIIEGRSRLIQGMPYWLNDNIGLAIDCAARPEMVNEIKELLGIDRAQRQEKMRRKHVDEAAAQQLRTLIQKRVDDLKRKSALALEKGQKEFAKITKHAEKVEQEIEQEIEEVKFEAATATTAVIDEEEPTITEAESINVETQVRSMVEAAKEVAAAVEPEDAPLSVIKQEYSQITVVKEQLDPIKIDEDTPLGHILLVLSERMSSKLFDDHMRSAYEIAKECLRYTAYPFTLRQLSYAVDQLAKKPYHVLLATQEVNPKNNSQTKTYYKVNLARLEKVVKVDVKIISQ